MAKLHPWTESRKGNRFRPLRSGVSVITCFGPTVII